MADSTLADLRTAGQTMLAANADNVNDLIYYWDDSQTGIAKSRSMTIAELLKLVASMSVSYVSSATLTRPANVTAYTAGDCVGGALTFATIAPSAGGRIAIANLDIIYNIAAIAAGMNFRLYLYSVTPPSAIADNAAWDLPSGDRASYLGYVDIGVPQDLGSSLVSQADALNKIVSTASGSLYGYLVALTGFTPAANSETYTIRILSYDV